MNKKPNGGASHYKQHSIEPIHVIEDWELDFRLANVIKYIARFRYEKGDGNWRKKAARTLNKAIWYLNRYIQIELGKEYMEYEYIGLPKVEHVEEGEPRMTADALQEAIRNDNYCEHGIYRDMCSHCQDKLQKEEL